MTRLKTTQMKALLALRCPTECGRPKRHTGDHLCGACFLQLPQGTRYALNLRDSLAPVRSVELLRQISADVALSKITIEVGYESPPTNHAGTAS